MITIPTYSALLETTEDGITTISWVANPATAVDMICFSEYVDSKYTFAEDDKQLVTSVVMLADTKIYRNDGGYEYYITYDKDTLIKMCEKMLADNTFNNISFEHDGNIIESGKVSLVELYTVDSNKPSPFNVPYGSIVATYKVNDNELWPHFKSGEISGISLEGYFTVKQVEKYTAQHKSMFTKIKETIKSILVEFTAIKTDNGVLYTDAEELAEGVTVANEDGNSVEDGTYTLEDGTVVTVKDSVVESIEKVDNTEVTETTEETTEEMTEEVTETPENQEGNDELQALKDEVDALKGELNGLKDEITALKDAITELQKQPAGQSVAEEYESVVNDNKYARMGAALRR